MKRIMKILVERLTGAKVHADHTAIKGRKSSGSEDHSNVLKNWKQGSNSN